MLSWRLASVRVTRLLQHYINVAKLAGRNWNFPRTSYVCTFPLVRWRWQLWLNRFYCQYGALLSANNPISSVERTKTNRAAIYCNTHDVRWIQCQIRLFLSFINAAQFGSCHIQLCLHMFHKYLRLLRIHKVHRALWENANQSRLMSVWDSPALSVTSSWHKLLDLLWIVIDIPCSMAQRSYKGSKCVSSQSPRSSKVGESS